MTADLETTIGMDDRKLRQDVKRAEGVLSGFAGKVKGFSGGLKSAIGLGGAAVFIGAAVDTLEKMHSAQSRINAGVGTFEDKWVASRGALSGFLTELPLVGQYIDKLNKYMDDYEGEKLRSDGAEETKKITKQIERQYELTFASSEELRKVIQMKHEEQDVQDQLQAAYRKTGDAYGDQLTKQMAITDFKRDQLTIAKSMADQAKIEAGYKKESAERDAARERRDESNTSFYDMVEQQQISGLRSAGMNDEANKRSAEAERLKRIRDIDYDETLANRPYEATRRKEIVNLLAQLEQQKQDASTKNISVGSVGSASLLGQFFAPGAMNEQKREQKKLGDTAQAILKQIEIIARKRDNPSMYN